MKEYERRLGIEESPYEYVSSKYLVGFPVLKHMKNRQDAVASEILIFGQIKKKKHRKLTFQI
jgi:hypothetical protein